VLRNVKFEINYLILIELKNVNNEINVIVKIEYNIDLIAKK